MKAMSPRPPLPKRPAAYDVEAVRAQFPCLHQAVNGKPLAFLDSAASAQKPQAVIDCLADVYGKGYANIHRGMYYLSNLATDRFEKARDKAAAFLNAASRNEIVFTQGATDGINLAAHCLGEAMIRAGDEIIISGLEHHANIVPWQELCKRKGTALKCAPIDADGNLPAANVLALLTKRTKIVAVTHMSNALGTVTPLKAIIDGAHEAGAVVLVDASQSVVHREVDVQALDCDLLVFSGHKLYGPNGVGVLYGKYALLESLPPYRTGGEMIDRVDLERGTTFQLPPMRFEAGTPAIAEAIAFGAAVDFVQGLDREAARRHERTLLDYALEEMRHMPNFTIVCERADREGVIPFVHKTAHPADLGDVLDRCGVAVRTGHHCAQPLLRRLGYGATARASFAAYTNAADVEAFLAGLKKADKMF
jgi:cysteine desulfurase/selenocysteine lyase